MGDRRKDDKSVAERIVGASAVTATVTLVGGVLMVGGQPVSAADQVVDTLDDVVDAGDGLTSLREALDDAGDGDTITFDPALFTGGPGTITASALYGDFNSSYQITLTGPGAALLTLTNPTGDVLYLYGGGQTVSGLTIADAGQDGIDLYRDSSGLPTALTDIVISGAGDRGIEGDYIGDLVLTRVTITGSDDDGANLEYLGGALTITDSTITDNYANGVYVYGDVDGALSISGSSISNNGDDGLRVYDDVYGDVTITDSTLSANGSSGFEVEDDVYGALTITDSTFTGNYDDGFYVDGFVEDDVTVTNSTFSDNGDDGFLIDGYVDGGLSVTDSTVSGNEYDGFEIDGGVYGGGVTITDSTFSGNAFTGFEVDGYVDGDVSVVDSTISDNGDGGFLIDDDVFGAVTVTDSTVSGNGDAGFEIDGQVDGGLSVSGSSLSGNDDVGLYVTESVAGDVSLTDSNFDDNVDAVRIGDGGAYASPAVGGSVTVADSTFSGAADDGLVLYGNVVGDVTITDSTFDSVGSATDDAALYLVSTDGAVSISGSTFSNSSAPVVLMDVASGAEIVNSTFSGNGGDSVIEIGAGELTISNSTISGNTPSVGAVTTADAVVGIDNSIVTDNDGAGVSAIEALGTGSVDTTFSLVPVGSSLAASNTETDAPLLGALADNGGTTLTRLPLAGSPAVNAGNPAFVAPPAVDQRGAERVQGGVVDAGAVEVAPVFVTSLTPTRYLDTRSTGVTFDGQFEGNGIRPSMSTLTLDVGGRGAVPDDAEAVVINVTAVRASGKGFVTAYPCGVDQPVASSLNYDAGVNMANELIVTLPASGDVCLYTNTETHLVADVVGFVPAGSGYGGLTPARLLDTRSTGETIDGDFEGGTKPVAGNQIELQVAGRGGVPVDARAVIVNVTSVAADDRGFVTVHPCLPTLPVVSSLNYTAGTNRANEVIAQLDDDGKLCVYNNTSTHLLVDVVGWLPADAGYSPVSPARLVDTRATGETVDGLQEGDGIRPADSELVVKVTGRADVPDTATGVVVNVTAIGATENGFITVYDCEGTRPTASSLNYVAGVNSPNEVIAGLNADGEFCVYTLRSINIAVDVVGYTTD